MLSAERHPMLVMQLVQAPLERVHRAVFGAVALTCEGVVNTLIESV